MAAPSTAAPPAATSSATRPAPARAAPASTISVIKASPTATAAAPLKSAPNAPRLPRPGFGVPSDNRCQSQLSATVSTKRRTNSFSEAATRTCRGLRVQACFVYRTAAGRGRPPGPLDLCTFSSSRRCTHHHGRKGARRAGESEHYCRSRVHL